MHLARYQCLLLSSDNIHHAYCSTLHLHPASPSLVRLSFITVTTICMRANGSGKGNGHDYKSDQLAGVTNISNHDSELCMAVAWGTKSDGETLFNNYYTRKMLLSGRASLHSWHAVLPMTYQQSDRLHVASYRHLAAWCRHKHRMMLHALQPTKHSRSMCS